MKSVGEEGVGSMQMLCCFTKRTGASADFGLCGGCWNQSSTNTEGWLDRNAQKRMSKKEREKNNEKGVNIWKEHNSFTRSEVTQVWDIHMIELKKQHMKASLNNKDKSCTQSLVH